MRGLALAFEIERYYTAVESLFARALRSLDGEAPAGGTWHLELLRAAATGIEGGRPPLVSREAADELREILQFRHLARHGYEREPVLERMEDDARRVARVHPQLGGSLDALAAWLSRP